MNFANIQLKDIEGRDVPHELNKVVGNLIYIGTKDLGFLDKAQAIYRGEDVELTDDELKEVRRVIDASQLSAFARKAIIDSL